MLILIFLVRAHLAKPSCRSCEHAMSFQLRAPRATKPPQRLIRNEKPRSHLRTRPYRDSATNKASAYSAHDECLQGLIDLYFWPPTLDCQKSYERHFPWCRFTWSRR